MAVSRGLRIQLLGGFCVCVGSRTIEGSSWRLRKAAAIVKLLALAPHHQLYREQITDLLWPDLEPRAAANNLRRTLYAARRILSPSSESRSLYLQGDPLSLCQGAPAWVDVEAFEAAAVIARRVQDPASYSEAIDLYTGDLLPEDRYEDWAANRREELRRTYLSLLSDLARRYEERGEIGAAIETLQRVVDSDPAHEDAHLGLMRLYARAGRRYQALQQYQRLQEALLREIDAAPDPNTQRVYQSILSNRFPATDPPPVDQTQTAPPAVQRHNLPAPVTAFIGRERAIAEVTRLLAQVRLLALVGPGGCGKTRLAMETALRLVDRYPDGVWLVELAAVADPELVPQAVASALGVPEQPGRPLTETLSNDLETKHLLLVMDNCEHLVDACAALTDSLLRACPRMQVLATSRQALNIAGEQVWRVPSLELPDVRHLLPRDEIARSEAVRLFLDRARLSRPGFALTDGNAGTVAQVCQRLDGMPLAIELAAARLRALSVEQIAALLDDRFRLLTGGSRAALPRQRTLRATIDWSYDLLDETKRTLFDRLSVFAGGWMLEAAEAVCPGPSVASDRILDLMAGLVDRSLVLSEVDEAGAMRYRLLETLRQYGRERLAERGEAEEVRRRHAAYYFALAAAAEPELTGPRQVAWLDRLEREHDNFRAALGGAFESGDTETGARLCGALGRFWYEHSHLRGGVHWLDAALSAPGTLPEPVCAKALTWAGLLRSKQGDYAQAQAELEESLELWQALGDRRNSAFVLNILGSTARYQGDIERATALCKRAIVMAQEGKDKWHIALSLYQLGYMAQYRGEVDRATALHKESMVLFREAGDQRRVAAALINLADLAMHRDDTEGALALYREGLELADAVREGFRIAESLEGLGDVARTQGQPARAARLFGAAEALREATGFPVPPIERATYNRRLDATRGMLDQAAYAAAWAEGRAMPQAQAIAYAQTVEHPAVIAPGKPTMDGRALPLTPRQMQVAALVARGLTNREIAAELVIAEGTAANHVQHILSKLGYHSRGQIAAWAAERGLRSEE